MYYIQHTIERDCNIFCSVHIIYCVLYTILYVFYSLFFVVRIRLYILMIYIGQCIAYWIDYTLPNFRVNWVQVLTHTYGLFLLN